MDNDYFLICLEGFGGPCIKFLYISIRLFQEDVLLSLPKNSYNEIGKWINVNFL